MSRLCQTLLSLALATALSACNSSSTSSTTAGKPSTTAGGASGGQWSDYNRDADYPTVYSGEEEGIHLRDGVRLSAKVTLPADADGNPEPGASYPCILTQTGYNKSAGGVPAVNNYLVQRGYAHFSVDVRGTGLSGGVWQAFGEQEQQDYREVMDWVASHPRCNGNIGTWGASFMGITQLLTAAQQHPAHKAVFAIVPMGDAYRDIVFSGGQVNVGFIPLWMGLVTGLGAIPTQDAASAEGFEQYLTVSTEHVLNAVTQFQLPLIADALIGQNGINYDGPFWRTRSPLEVADNIRVPSFIVGGLNDIFQRGEPLLYETIKDHALAKLLIGPWQHIAGSMGQGLPRDGVPSLDDIALRWFDRYLRGEANGAEQLPAVTQYYYGEERYVTAPDWPHPQLRAQALYLHGDRSLSPLPPQAGESSQYLLQQPLNGICSASTAQWTAGAIGLLPLPSCFTDSNLAESLEVTYTSAPMPRDMVINGPIQANIWVATTALDASLVVRVSDVSPLIDDPSAAPLTDALAAGPSRELSNGILTASMRAVDSGKSRYIGAQMIQPWHPFTEEGKLPVAMNEPMLLNVEVFPTSAVIKAGHRLRISVGASDFPHGLPPLTELLNQPAGVLTVFNDAEHPSSVVLPLVPQLQLPAASADSGATQNSDNPLAQWLP